MTRSKSIPEVTSSSDSEPTIQISPFTLFTYKFCINVISRIQLFHCHIEWHVEAGLVATFIEAPEKLQSSLTIPPQHQEICEQQGIPTMGNAAGNTEDYTDLRGANTKFEKDNWGYVPISRLGT